MKNGIILAAFMAALCTSAETVKTATQPWVRSYVATNHTDVTCKADKTNVYTKAETDAKIVELAPTPGDYATVSNKAVTAIQEHQSLWPAVAAATNYADAALGAFAETGTVWRAGVYGTPTRWTDATGCVWEVMLGVWVANNIGLPDGESVEWQGPSWNTTTEEYYYDRVGWFVTSSDLTPEYLGNDENAVTLELDWGRYDEIHGYYNVHTVFTRSLATNLVGRVALTNDIPDVSGYATPADVTAAIREQSLGGVYDSKLCVWWTPHMANGAYYWTATTNVNLNAEGN